MYKALGDISLDLLRTFEAAARHRSFTAAALELGTTQPAISQQLKRLESRLGIRLFDRIYRGIALTEAGLGLFLQVQAGLQQIDAGLQALSAQPAREVLQVATDFAFAAYWLMPRLPRFHAAYPQIDVSLLTRERSHDALQGVSARVNPNGYSTKKCSRYVARTCWPGRRCLYRPGPWVTLRCCSYVANMPASGLTGTDCLTLSSSARPRRPASCDSTTTPC